MHPSQGIFSAGVWKNSIRFLQTPATAHDGSVFDNVQKLQASCHLLPAFSVLPPISYLILKQYLQSLVAHILLLVWLMVSVLMR